MLTTEGNVLVSYLNHLILIEIYIFANLFTSMMLGEVKVLATLMTTMMLTEAQDLTSPYSQCCQHGETKCTELFSADDLKSLPLLLLMLVNVNNYNHEVLTNQNQACHSSTQSITAAVIMFIFMQTDKIIIIPGLIRTQINDTKKVLIMIRLCHQDHCPFGIRKGDKQPRY